MKIGENIKIGVEVVCVHESLDEFVKRLEMIKETIIFLGAQCKRYGLKRKVFNNIVQQAWDLSVWEEKQEKSPAERLREGSIR